MTLFMSHWVLFAVVLCLLSILFFRRRYSYNAFATPCRESCNGDCATNCCINGACQPTAMCWGSNPPCGGATVKRNTNGTDDQMCNGVRCPLGQACYDGTCKCDIQKGFNWCEREKTCKLNRANDVNSCGSCADKCPDTENQTCANGSCVCKPGYKWCGNGGKCIENKNDCNFVKKANEQCVAKAGAWQCPNGYSCQWDCNDKFWMLCDNSYKCLPLKNDLERCTYHEECKSGTCAARNNWMLNYGVSEFNPVNLCKPVGNMFS